MRLTIDRLGARGDGIAETREGPVYVPFSAPADVVEARPGKPRGEGRAAALEAVIDPGPDRRAPCCRHFTACGGCALQHVDAAVYATWKRNILIEALSRQGLSADVSPLVPVPPATRRLVRLAFQRTGRGLVLGFRAPESRHIVDLQECTVSHPDIVALLPPLRQFLAATARRGEVSVARTDSGLDIAVHAGEAPALEVLEAAAGFAEAADLARLSWTGRDGMPAPLVVRRDPLVDFGGVAVRPPPDAFLQPTEAGETALREVVAGALEGRSRIADLYAGCGAFGLPLAVRGRSVTLVEGVAAQTSAALSAARASGLSDRVEAETRDLSRRPLSPVELASHDGVILDPPRAGAAAQAEQLARSAVSVIVCVSCNPATFARDARTLVDGGYALTGVTPVDQFLWTPHLELAAVFIRR